MSFTIIAICVMIPIIFGAKLGEIINTWAPYSFPGGLLMLSAAITSIAIKLWIIGKNENRKKTSRGAAFDCHN